MADDKKYQGGGGLACLSSQRRLNSRAIKPNPNQWVSTPLSCLDYRRSSGKDQPCQPTRVGLES